MDVSPYVCEASKRANGEYPWMQNACYEPAPLPRHYGKPRMSLALRIFIVLAILVVIGGALAAFNS